MLPILEAGVIPICLGGDHFVAFNIVEVLPAYDQGQITALLAASIAFEMLTLVAARSASKG